MGLETGTYVSDLNTSNPTAGDPVSQADDHIRLLKSTLQSTFPEATAPIYGLRSGTATASTSGTSVDFTSIPSWVKRITVSFSAVSTNGTSLPMVQIGDAGGVEIADYAGAVWSPAAGIGAALSTGFSVLAAMAASTVMHGSVTLTLVDSATNTWAATSLMGLSAASTNVHLMGGTKSLSATLDRVRITTVNGTDTFDAGKVNILYE